MGGRHGKEGGKEEGTENHIIGGYRYHKLLLGSAPDRWEGSGSRARMRGMSCC